MRRKELPPHPVDSRARRRAPPRGRGRPCERAWAQYFTGEARSRTSCREPTVICRKRTSRSHSAIADGDADLGGGGPGAALVLGEDADPHVAGWISDPNCHLAQPRIVGVVEGEQEGGAMPAPAEGRHRRARSRPLRQGAAPELGRAPPADLRGGRAALPLVRRPPPPRRHPHRPAHRAPDPQAPASPRRAPTPRARPTRAPAALRLIRRPRATAARPVRRRRPSPEGAGSTSWPDRPAARPRVGRSLAPTLARLPLLLHRRSQTASPAPRPRRSSPASSVPLQTPPRSAAPSSGSLDRLSTS